MRVPAVPVCVLMFFCAACEPSEDTVADDLTQLEPTRFNEVANAAVELTGDQLVRICQLGQGFRVGRNPEIIKAKAAPFGIVRLSYTRDDGKFFEYDCKAEGNYLRYRMIDEAGPQTGPGAWSGRGSQTTFHISAGKVTIRDVFSDGSSDQETFDL